MNDWCQVDTPKIWASRFPLSGEAISFDLECRGERLIFLHAHLSERRHVDSDEAPVRIIFAKKREIPASQRDAFLIKNRVMVVSKALHDVMMQFDVDDVQFFEVPIHADEQGTPSGLPNHYVMNVYGEKSALIPELSENIEWVTPPGRPEQAKWAPTEVPDVVALDAGADEATDLWIDANYQSTLFFSDRLKQAIDASGLKVKQLTFAPTRVFIRN